jgi:carbonic anhydrase
MGVKEGARHVVLVPHGKCGGIAGAAPYVGEPCPADPEKSIHWQMAQAKREVFDDVRRKGADYYLSRLDEQAPHKNENDFVLQAAEICSALRDMRIVKEYLSYLKGGEDVTVSTAYVDFRTLNPYLLRITGAGADDWELLRLTDHPKIPCRDEKKEECSCPSPP